MLFAVINVWLRNVSFENVWVSSVVQHFRLTILMFVLFFRFVFFSSRRLSVTFDIQIDLKMKHP